MDLKIEIGKRMFEARKKKGYTQEQLADLLGISYKSISGAENGQKIMRPESLIKVCEVLDISLDYLLTGELSHTENELFNMRIPQLSGKQYEALKNIIENFLSVCE